MASRQFGTLATQLVTESRRSSATDTLFKYNDPLVRTIIKEQRDLDALVDASLAHLPSDDLSDLPPSIIIHQTAIARNKRCLLAYHQHRLDFLKSAYWSLGGALPPIISSPQLRPNMAPHEVDFLREYNALILDFRSDFSGDLDITSSVTDPPKDIHVHVKVLRECGVIQTEQGAIDFQKGHRFMVRRTDVEHLIIQGYLEEIHG